MGTRILAAVIGLGILIPTVLFGGVLGVEIAIAIVTLVCLDEYARMAFPESTTTSLVWMAAMSAVIGGGSLFVAPEHGLLFFAIAGVLTLCFSVFTVPELPKGVSLMGRYCFGLLWIPVLLAYIILIRRLDDGLLWLFLVMIVPWSSDTGGYFAGRFLGSHKMAPVISPKKTWEGFVGGLLLAVVAVLVYRALVFPTLTVADCLFLGLGLGAVGVVGDLAESLVKRSFDVKDSGWIIPGHGGMLDRIDALMFVAPLLYAYAVLVKG